MQQIGNGIVWIINNNRRKELYLFQLKRSAWILPRSLPWNSFPQFPGPELVQKNVLESDGILPIYLGWIADNFKKYVACKVFLQLLRISLLQLETFSSLQKPVILALGLPPHNQMYKKNRKLLSWKNSQPITLRCFFASQRNRSS